MYFVLEQSLLESILDSAIFNFIFSIFGINIWYVVRFAGLNPANVSNTLVTHLFSALILISLWLFVGSGIIKVILGNESEYSSYFSGTIYYRAAIGMLYYALIVLNYYMATFYREVQERKLHESETSRLLKETELSMLKAQINPHFIFNSLNSVSSLTLTNPEKAHDMVVNLAAFLRYTISPQEKKKVKLKEEIGAIQQYLAIEKVRFGDRLDVSVTIEDGLDDLLLPNLILQPLVENAIKYGVYESTDENRITIEGNEQKGQLEIIIKNDIAPDSFPRKGKGIGLNNVKARLKLIYDSDNLLEIENTKSQFTVKIIFPQ